MILTFGLMLHSLAPAVGLEPPQAIPKASVIVERTAWLMGTTLTIRAATDTESDGFAAIETAFEAVRAMEARLSTWRDDSELSLVNHAAPGTWVPLSAPLGQLLRVARQWRDSTAGAFDPAVGSLIDAWALRGGGRTPTGRELRRALAAAGFEHVSLGANGTAIRKDVEGVWLDSGAFGKGAALGVARRALEARGVTGATLDFGGQLLLFGRSTAPGDGHVVVAHPSRRDRPAVGLSVRDGSVATSGQSERWVEVDGQPIGHILDPRSGRPAPAWGSVTVVHADPLAADILATALYVMGPDVGFEWATTHGVAALFLVAPPVQTTSGQGLIILCSDRLKPFLDMETSCG